ncbi:hypothetical protein RvY_06380 [Ramazzottius varieornatus]|uniref:Uncharacterized protein n=1 Tax=Ramazzottius varieornatus TaxID=947166 RepID=A0A1D1V4S0_RAMVA|nr:hypothetical protein RvY_06380 [Ramazzottius varieornatus]
MSLYGTAGLVFVLILEYSIKLIQGGDVYTIASCHWCKLTGRSDTSSNCSAGQSVSERGYNSDCSPQAPYRFCHGPTLANPGPLYHGCAVSRPLDLAQYPELCTYDDLKLKLADKAECVCDSGLANADTQQLLRGSTCQMGDMAVEWKVTVTKEEEAPSCQTGCIAGICLGLGFFAAIITCLFYGIHRNKKGAKSKSSPPQAPAANASAYPIHPTGPVRHK